MAMEFVKALMGLDDKQVLEETAMIAEVDKKYKSAEGIMQNFHRQWFTNIAMRRGLQYVQTHSSARVVVQPPESDSRVRMTINKMLGIHQIRLAKIAKDLPKPQVVPASKQEQDKELARKGTKLLDWLWADQRMTDKMLEAASWMIDCGTAFFRVWWNPEAGEKIPVYKRPGPHEKGRVPINEEGYVIDEEGNPIIEEEIAMGSPQIDVLPPFDGINDGIGSDIPKSKWFMTVQMMALDEIETQWPKRGALVKPEKDINTRGYYERRLLSLVGNESEYFSPEKESEEKMALVKTYYERPSVKNPKGRYRVVANGVLLESGDLPYDHLEIPIIKVDDMQVSGAFWGIGTMENLIPVQKGYNRTFSQITENANSMGNVKVVLNKDHGLTKEAYDDSGSEILEVNPDAFVQQLQPAELPGYVQNQIGNYDKAFNDVSGVQDVSQARLPEGIKSGRAIMALQEQDDTRLAPTKLRFLRAIEKVAVQALQLFEQFQTEDRTYQIVGETVYDIEDFTISLSDIRNINKDVRVQHENLIASNKALMQEQILEMYNSGLFGPVGDPAVRKRVLQLLEFGSVAEFFEDENQDAAMASRENRIFMEGGKGLTWITDPKTNQAVPTLTAYEFEDHNAHLRIINQLRKTVWYQELPPYRRRGIDIHAEQHEMFLRKQNGIPAPQPSPPPRGKGKGPMPAAPTPEPVPPGADMAPEPTPPMTPTAPEFGGIGPSMDGFPPGLLPRGEPPGIAIASQRGKPKRG